jgi:histidyl-tRNA synthetase
MSLSKSPYRGTRDFFPEMKRERDYLFARMSAMAERYGYEPYDGPLLEEVELYKAKSGEELINEQIYSFTDRGERFVAIRPEMTPTLARMIAQVHREVPKPIRWYSIPNLMRYEKPQRGRLREHWQFNCDIFGAPEGHGEAEILSVLVSLFSSLGATSKNFSFLINDRRIVDSILNDALKVDKETTYKLYKIIDRSKKVSSEALEKMIVELSLTDNQTQTLKSYLECKTFADIFTLTDKLGLSEKTFPFRNFLALAPSYELMDYLVYDPTIVRGLDYYTGIVFEAFDLHPDNKRALCGGGAYSGLLSIFNEEPVPGVGVGLGDVTVTDFLKTHNLMPDFSKPSNELFVSCQEASGLNQVLKLAAQLRQYGLKVVSSLEPVKFKKAFNQAEKHGARFIVLAGVDELSRNSFIIKRLADGTQKVFTFDQTQDCLSFLRELP